MSIAADVASHKNLVNCGTFRSWSHIDLFEKMKTHSLKCSACAFLVLSIHEQHAPPSIRIEVFRRPVKVGFDTAPQFKSTIASLLVKRQDAVTFANEGGGTCDEIKVLSAQDRIKIPKVSVYG